MERRNNSRSVDVYNSKRQDGRGLCSLHLPQSLRETKGMLITTVVCLLFSMVFFVFALIQLSKYIESVISINRQFGLPIFFGVCHSNENRWSITLTVALSTLLVSYAAYSSSNTLLDGTEIFWMSLAAYFAIWTILKSPRWDDLALFLAMTQYITIFLIPAEKQWMPLLPMMLAVGMFHFHGDIQQTRKKQPKRSMSYWRGRQNFPRDNTFPARNRAGLFFAKRRQRDML